MMSTLFYKPIFMQVQPEAPMIIIYAYCCSAPVTLVISTSPVTSDGATLGPAWAGLPTNPNLLKSAVSSSKAGLSVVNNLSPLKIELAPAWNIKYCSASEKESLPALRRTIVRGMTMRAVAIILAMSKASTSAIPSDSVSSSAAVSPRGVPSTATRALMGTLSGCSGSVDRTWRRPTRSVSFSPRPRMPPQQTLIPASRTLAIVSKRSSYDRVVMTLG
mmetsp:Transcript_44889/g.94190  ORF Transcript_44889/g.94190 Transcript_44889/m.94190 type:complete len:218 (-) Transcript_44889:815-1468(-)